MKVLVLRHGQRQGVHDDLTLIGRQQARDLVLSFMDHNHWLHPFRPSELLCSPKIRCQQTIRPLSEALKLSLGIVNELDERSPRESAENFTERIRLFLSRLEKRMRKQDSILICSHFDWLAEFIAVAPSDLLAPEDIQHFSPGEIHGFEIEHGVWCYKGPRDWA